MKETQDQEESYNEIITKESPRSRIIDTKLYLKIIVKETQDQEESYNEIITNESPRSRIIDAKMY